MAELSRSIDTTNAMKLYNGLSETDKKLANVMMNALLTKSLPM